MVFYFKARPEAGDYTIYMGVDKHENEELIKYGFPEDIWFHVDNMSSAHVYLRLNKGQTIDDISEGLLEDCAQLVKANSIQGNKVNNIDVVYTPWYNLKKTPPMDVGEVGFQNPKMVRTVRVEKQINEIVNRLNKTKVERKPELKEVEMVKERFAKLLLGEDMSGGGKGVSSALALSNAITNLAASVFGEQRRLEPMSTERKCRWRKEIEWLLSVTDYIVEFVPSQQKSSDGTSMEIMVTRQRTDLHMNIPALRKLDAMLIDHLDNFKDHNEFWYVSRDEKEGEKGNSQKKDDKWWLPTVKVPPKGLSDVSRKWLQFQKESVNQVLKAAMAINAQVLSEMEIPEAYIESLPKNGRASLGDSIYRSITVDSFDPQQFLSTLDLSTEHKILDVKNRIEASVVIWQRKMLNKDGKSSWGSAVSLEKRELFEERAETILVMLKQRFPGLPQSALDISKIQYNRDVGQSVLESYSRILESLAFTVISRIEDVLDADSLAQDPSLTEATPPPSQLEPPEPPVKLPSAEEELEKLNPLLDTPSSMTLSDFMGWHLATEAEKTDSHNLETMPSSDDGKLAAGKPDADATPKKFSYTETLLGNLRSPTSRH